MTAKPLLPTLAGSLAGLLAGIDLVLLAFILRLLAGPTGADLSLPGLGYARWSANEGIAVGLEFGGLLFLLGMMVAGALAARAIAARRQQAQQSRERSSGRRSGLPA